MITMNQKELEILKDIIYNSEEDFEKKIEKNTIYTYNYVVMLILLGYYNEEYTKIHLELDRNYFEINSKYKRLESVSIGEKKYKVPERFGRIDFWKLIYLLIGDGFEGEYGYSKSEYIFFVNNNKIKEIIENNENKVKKKQRIQ